MKNLFATLSLLAFLAIPAQGAFAWTYEGPNSLNPFTGFRQCNKCVTQKVVKCKKPKLTKCEKLHGVKIIKGQPCGCAAPVEYIKVMPMQNNCQSCHRAF